MISDTLKFYKEESILGSGAFGIVYAGYEINAKGERIGDVAIKVLRNIDDKCFFDEIGLLQFVQGHSNIIQLKSFVKDGEFSYIVCENMRRDLGAVLYQEDSFGIRTFPNGCSLEFSKKCLQQICSALEFLRLKGIVHGDIKPNTVLIDDKEVVKLAYFCIACKVSDVALKTIQSPVYRSPEVWLEKEFDTKADIWSAGVVFFEVFTGGPIICYLSEIQTQWDVFHTLLMLDRQLNGEWLLSELQKRKGAGLYTETDALAFFSVIQLMLVSDPSKRSTATQVLQCLNQGL